MSVVLPVMRQRGPNDMDSEVNLKMEEELSSVKQEVKEEAKREAKQEDFKERKARPTTEKIVYRCRGQCTEIIINSK